MINLQIYGLGGYLGSEITSTPPPDGIVIHRLQRDEWPTHPGVVLDLSVPTQPKNSLEIETYQQLISQRTVAAGSVGCTYIYAGSTSSAGSASSAYGLLKQQTEDIVKSHGGIVVRFGLICNWEKPGGRFKEFVEILGRLPIVPCPDEREMQLFLTSHTCAVNTIFNACTFDFQDNDYISFGTTEGSLGEIARSYAHLHNKRTIRIQRHLIKILLKLIQAIPNRLDPLKSLTTHRNIAHLPTI